LLLSQYSDSVGVPDYALYDYVDRHGRNPIKDWSRRLEKGYLAKLNDRLRKLRQVGMDMLPLMLAGVRGHPHLYKLKMTGRVTLRPLLCRGPINMEREFTLLVGAFEQNRRFDPPSAPDDADQCREEITEDPSRRTPHVWVRRGQ